MRDDLTFCDKAISCQECWCKEPCVVSQMHPRSVTVFEPQYVQLSSSSYGPEIQRESKKYHFIRLVLVGT